MLKHEALPVDAPFLSLEDGKKVPPAKSIAPQLERARVMRIWGRQAKSSRSPKPSTDVDFYRVDLIDPKRASTRTKIRNAANQVLWSIPGGTLVVVPSNTLGGNAILAEILPRKEPRVVVEGEGRASGLVYPARKLRGLKQVPMRYLPESVTDAARTVKVVEEISGHAEDRVLRQYYGDYQRANDRVTGLLAGTDDFDARVIGQMIELHMAVEHALTTGNSLRPGAALFDRSVTSSPYFHARVDSPNGRAHLESASVATFVVKLLMVAAAAGLPGLACAEAIEAGQLIVENSKDVGGVELVEASKKALVDFVRTSGHDNAATYIEALQDGLNRNAANVAGEAELSD